MTELQRKNRQAKILKFLLEHKCISVKCIEESAKIPVSTIGQAMSGNRSMPVKAIEKLIPILKKYGYK